MNDDPSDMAGINRAQFLLDQSGKALGDMLTAFDIMAERMRSGDDVSVSELAKSLTAMSQARTRLINEVKEHDDRGLFSGGNAGEAALDLESIRTDIGRRLDRIREALDTEGFS